MSMLEKAIEIASAAHAGQRDQQGSPYILHPLRVMSRVDGEAAQMVAVLHDVVEDTTVTLDDLRAAGFSADVITAVECVTHRQQESYAEYVIRCNSNALARQVKLADLEENSQITRVLLRRDREEADLARIHRYVLSYKFLTGQLDEGEYRAWMASN